MKTNKERFLAGEPFRLDVHRISYDKKTPCLEMTIHNEFYCSIESINDDYVTIFGYFLTHLVTMNLFFKDIRFVKDIGKEVNHG